MSTATTAPPAGAGRAVAESAPAYAFRYVRADDPLARPLLDDLEREYDTRYGQVPGHEPAAQELGRYPAERFAEPDGAFLLLLEDGEPVSGGAFFRVDAEHAEIKRVWTRGDRRGRGFARVVLTELEAEARRLGYAKVVLTTGHRQPEAVALYRGHGYTPLFDVTRPAAEIGVHAFEKRVDDRPVVPRATIATPPARHRTRVEGDHEIVLDEPTADPAPRGADPEPAPERSAAAAHAAEAAPAGASGRRVVPLKHWGRWIFSALAVFVVAQFVWTFFSNPQWRWPVFAQFFFDPAVVRGLWLTLWLTAVSSVIGFALGAVLAVARLSGSPLLSSFAWGFIWFFRSVPLIVQLVLWYNLGYLFPQLGLGWPFTYDFWIAEFDTVTLISATAAAIIGLSLHQAAYAAEIIRGGLLSVDQGQLEAARALGIPRGRRFFRIVLPQALRAILPNAFNELIGMLKGTSVVFIVALPELFYTVQVIYNRNQQVVPLLLVATVWYTIFTSILSVAQYYIERRFARGSARELPPTPLQKLRSKLRGIRRRLSEGAAGAASAVSASAADPATVRATACLDTDQTAVQAALTGPVPASAGAPTDPTPNR